MGWFWGSSKGKDGSNAADPLKNLDPTLRDFLDKESPVKYTSSPSAEPTPKYTDQLPSAAEPQKVSETGVPPQSLFPDGRYAHLWRTYTPLAEVEAAGKSDQDKLLDIIDGFKERKAMIGRAALENCSMEQLAVSDCFKYGGWKSRMTMCRAENKQFENCYMMQSRFLKALGYLSTYDRPAEVDERIQMHADKLYHQMLEQEAAIEKAKAEGLPVPTFKSLLPTPGSAGAADLQLPPVPTTITTPADLKPSAQAQIEKRLKGLSPEQRAIEEKAITAEIAVGQQLASQLDAHLTEQDKARQRRREKGKETFGDVITRWLRF